MPPLLALLGSFGLIVWLFRLDARERPVGSPALWIPGLWLLILSTRPAAYWVYSRTEVGETSVQGNPVDFAILGLLMVSACLVLVRRKVNLGAVISANKSIFVLYLYLLSSVLWADFPLVASKRIFKDFGVVLFALALLTEQDPSYAIRKVFLRCSYIVFTLSVITIKYFPAIGTIQSRAGNNTFTGLTTQKNTLGEMAFIYLIIILWDVTILLRTENVKWKDPPILLRGFMFALGVWLLNISQSKTSLLSLIIGIALFLLTGWMSRRPHLKLKLAGMFLGLLLLYTLNSVFHVDEMVVNAVGKNMTFTGRTTIWDEVLAQPVDPILGTGYMMFWDGPFGRRCLDNMGVDINEAHNGYLETYLDGGMIGVVLLAAMLLARGYVIINRLAAGGFWGRLGFIFWFLALFHNLSESSFFRLGLLWFLLMLSMIELPAALSRRATPSSAIGPLPAPG